MLPDSCSLEETSRICLGCSEKEVVVQLAKQLALFGARGKNTDSGLWEHQFLTSTSGDEAISKTQPALVLQAHLYWIGLWHLAGSGQRECATIGDECFLP